MNTIKSDRHFGSPLKRVSSLSLPWEYENLRGKGDFTGVNN